MTETLPGPAQGADLTAAAAGDLLPVGLLLLAAAGLSGVILLLSALLGPRRSRTSLTPYECGSLPFVSARQKLSVKFYLVAMLFILFDIEAAFMIPWAVTFKGFDAARLFVLVEMVVFLGILIAGFVYIWSRGALEWE